MGGGERGKKNREVGRSVGRGPDRRKGKASAEKGKEERVKEEDLLHTAWMDREEIIIVFFSGQSLYDVEYGVVFWQGRKKGASACCYCLR